MAKKTEASRGVGTKIEQARTPSEFVLRDKLEGGDAFFAGLVKSGANPEKNVALSNLINYFEDIKRFIAKTQSAAGEAIPARVRQEITRLNDKFNYAGAFATTVAGVKLNIQNSKENLVRGQVKAALDQVGLIYPHLKAASEAMMKKEVEDKKAAEAAAEAAAARAGKKDQDRTTKLQTPAEREAALREDPEGEVTAYYEAHKGELEAMKLIDSGFKVVKFKDGESDDEKYEKARKQINFLVGLARSLQDFKKNPEALKSSVEVDLETARAEAGDTTRDFTRPVDLVKAAAHKRALQHFTPKIDGKRIRSKEQQERTAEQRARAAERIAENTYREKMTDRKERIVTAQEALEYLEPRLDQAKKLLLLPGTFTLPKEEALTDEKSAKALIRKANMVRVNLKEAEAILPLMPPEKKIDDYRKELGEWKVKVPRKAQPTDIIRLGLLEEGTRDKHLTRVEALLLSQMGRTRFFNGVRERQHTHKSEIKKALDNFKTNRNDLVRLYVVPESFDITRIGNPEVVKQLVERYTKELPLAEQYSAEPGFRMVDVKAADQMLATMRRQVPKGEPKGKETRIYWASYYKALGDGKDEAEAHLRARIDKNRFNAWQEVLDGRHIPKDKDECKAMLLKLYRIQEEQQGMKNADDIDGAARTKEFAVDVKLSDLIEQAVEKLNTGVPQVIWSKKDILGNEKMAAAERELRLHLFAFLAKEQAGFVFKEKRGARDIVFTLTRAADAAAQAATEEARPEEAQEEAPAKEKHEVVHTDWSRKNPDDAEAALKVIAACKKAHEEGEDADEDELEAKITAAIRTVSEYKNAFLADKDLRAGAKDFWLKNEGYDVWFDYWNDILEQDESAKVVDETSVVAEVLGAEAAKKAEESIAPEDDTRADEKAEEELGADDDEDDKKEEADVAPEEDDESEPGETETAPAQPKEPSEDEKYRKWQKEHEGVVQLINKKFVMHCVRALATDNWVQANEVVKDLKAEEGTDRAMIRRLVREHEVGNTFSQWKPEKAIAVLNELWGTEN